MAEPFPLANDGLALGFAFLVELIHILDRSLVYDMPHFTLPEEAIQHAAAGQQSEVPFVQQSHWPARHLLPVTHKDAAGVLHRDRPLQDILNVVQRQAGIRDG